MSTAVTHFIVGACIAAPVAAVTRSDSGVRPVALVASAGLVAAVPDLDAALFGVVPYAHFFGHRGFFHSPFFLVLLSFALSSLVLALARGVRAADWLTMFVVFSLAGASHSVLDAMSDAGLGVMLAFPFSRARYFLPWRIFYTPPVRAALPDKALLLRMASREAALVGISLLASAVLTTAARRWARRGRDRRAAP